MRTSLSPGAVAEALDQAEPSGFGTRPRYRWLSGRHRAGAPQAAASPSGVVHRAGDDVGVGGVGPDRQHHGRALAGQLQVDEEPVAPVHVGQQAAVVVAGLGVALQADAGAGREEQGPSARWPQGRSTRPARLGSLVSGRVDADEADPLRRGRRCDVDGVAVDDWSIDRVRLRPRRPGGPRRRPRWAGRAAAHEGDQRPRRRMLRRRPAARRWVIGDSRRNPPWGGTAAGRRGGGERGSLARGCRSGTAEGAVYGSPAVTSQRGGWRT